MTGLMLLACTYPLCWDYHRFKACLAAGLAGGVCLLVSMVRERRGRRTVARVSVAG
ncbi:MAG TPA: hypothetical protein VGB92_19480 [Longimicrobium sp.]